MSKDEALKIINERKLPEHGQPCEHCGQIMPGHESDCKYMEALFTLDGLARRA